MTSHELLISACEEFNRIHELNPERFPSEIKVIENPNMRMMGLFIEPNGLLINPWRCQEAPADVPTHDFSVRATLFHEAGHCLDHFGGTLNTELPSGTVSLYGTKNIKERFAEAFMIYCLHEGYLHKVNAAQHAYFKDLIKLY